MQKFSRLFIYALLFFFPLLSIAQDKPFLGIPNAHPYIGVMFGFAFEQVSGTSQKTILYQPGFPDTFATHSSSSAMQYGLMGGVTIPRPNLNSSHWFTAYQVEASIWQLSSASINGVHTINYPPIIDDFKYNYQYALQLQAFSLDTSVNVYQWHKLASFVGVGIDLAQAIIKNYQETPQGSALSNDFNIANKTNNLLMYHARIGVRYELPKHWQAQLAYTYYPNINISTGNGNTGVMNVGSLYNSVSISNLGLTISYQF